MTGRGTATPELLRALPAAFTFAQARQGGLSERNLRELRELGRVETLARGIYLRSDAAAADTDLLQIAARAPEATLCLRSALARHELIDDIPFEIDLAIPRGKRRPATTAPARWHHFDADTFHLGQGRLSLAGGLSIGLYSPERCIVDAFRLRHLEGTELAHQSLKAWLRTRHAQPAALLRLAKSFPKAEPSLRQALELLL